MQKPFNEMRGDKETGYSDEKIASSNHLVKEVLHNKFTSGENQRIFNNQYLNFGQGTLQMV